MRHTNIALYRPRYTWQRLALVLAVLTLAACGGGSVDTSSSSNSSSTPSVTSIAPTTAQTGVATTFTLAGSNLPLTAVAALADGSCDVPTTSSSTRLTVVCTPGPVGPGWTVVTVKNSAVNGYWVGQADLVITGGAVAVTSMTPSTALTRVATTFTVSGSNLPLTAAVSLAGGSCATPTNVTAQSLRVVCTPGDVGAATATIYSSPVASGGYWIGQADLTVATTLPNPTSLLTDTGISANQCYASGSDVLVSCSSAGATALNTMQDGMTGRDVSNGSASDGVLAMDYSLVGPSGDCLKDAVTGLTWQRASTTLVQLPGNEMNTEANDLATTANRAVLCGSTDWRVPSREELESLLLYGQDASVLAIDTTWFPATKGAWYLTSTQFVGGSSANVWVVDFATGRVDVIGASGSGGNIELRLVR